MSIKNPNIWQETSLSYNKQCSIFSFLISDIECKWRLFVKKSPSTDLRTLVKAILRIFNKKNYPIKIIGVRHGEKKHETLLSAEERRMSEDKNNFFIVNPDLRDLNYSKYYKEGSKKKKNFENYSSDQKFLLDVKQTIKLLKKSDIINNI